MRELILARDESHRLSIRLALDSAGIPFRAAPSPSAAIEFDDRRFWVDDADYARARELVTSLDEHSPLGDAAVTRRFKIFVAVAALAIVSLWFLLWMTASSR